MTKPTKMTTESETADLRRRIDDLEKAYEYFLAYAAQGLTRKIAAGKDAEVRAHLEKALAALDGLGARFRKAVPRDDTDRYAGFLDVLERDATAAAAALRIVLGKDGISSQLIDNVNASVHVRALLTDLFVLDEALEIPAED